MGEQQGSQNSRFNNNIGSKMQEFVLKVLQNIDLQILKLDCIKTEIVICR